MPLLDEKKFQDGPCDVQVAGSKIEVEAVLDFMGG